ncbi:MAG: hypothetical protein MI807_22105 [Verrucomicrobiales bacterium]|nr:hypothetical protein [Verrucomicrobiales bacterium]
MNKSDIVAIFRSQLSAQYERAISGLKGATEAATGDDTRAEGKYDTRGLEASYLAAGQAEQADELAEALAAFDAFEFPDFDFDDPVAPGALVETDRDGESLWFLLTPSGGGMTCATEEGVAVTTLGPSAPLRQKLLGATAGDILGEISVLEVM